MGRLVVFLLLFLFQIHTWASLLILEVETLNDTLEHAQDVSHIACRDLDPDQCVLLQGEKFLFAEYQNFQEFLPQAKVANMSLGFQHPVSNSNHHDGGDDGPTYSDQLDEYLERSKVFKEMITSYPNTLFVAASGNGYNLKVLWTDGVPLSSRFPMSPAFYQMNNLVSVSSLNTDRISYSEIDNYKIADYANYSLLNVELAAPVEKNSKGEEIRGTSFAAPYVSRLAHRLMLRNPNLSPLEVKELLMKSSFIIQIDRALEVTQDWLDKGSESMIARLESADNLVDRENALQEIGPIMLVKSGGPLVEEVAEICEILNRETGLSIEKSCLLAQQKVFGFNLSHIKKIQRLWQMRQF